MGELALEAVGQGAEPNRIEVVGQLNPAHSHLELIEFV
jgi:hypothetical protein